MESLLSFFACIGTMNRSVEHATCLESRLQAVWTGLSRDSERFMERPEGYLPTAVIYSRVLKNNVPAEIAGVAMHVSPSLFVATIENFPSAGTT